MEKSEKLILEAFIKAKTPKDFDNIDMGMFVMSIYGFADRLLHRGHLKLRKDEREIVFRLDEDTKKEIGKFVGNSSENLLYYNLIKSCYILFEKYKK